MGTLRAPARERGRTTYVKKLTTGRGRERLWGRGRRARLARAAGRRRERVAQLVRGAVHLAASEACAPGRARAADKRRGRGRGHERGRGRAREGGGGSGEEGQAVDARGAAAADREHGLAERDPRRAPRRAVEQRLPGGLHGGVDARLGRGGRDLREGDPERREPLRAELVQIVRELVTVRALSEAKARRAQRWAGIEGRQKSHLTRSEGPRRRIRCTPLVRCTRTCAAGAEASVSSRWRATALLAQGKARPPASHSYEWAGRMLTSKTAAPPPSKKNAKNANHSPCGVHPLT